MTERAHEGGPEIDIEDVVQPKPCRHVTGKTPASVSIIAMGPSQRVWHNGNGSYNLGVPRPEEVWCLNKGLRTVKCDVGFVLDDLVGEARKSPEYHRDLQALSLPIITSTIDGDVRRMFPSNRLTAFPLQEIYWELGVRWLVAAKQCDLQEIIHNPETVFRCGEVIGSYLRNSVPMMLAYALWIGVKTVYLYGADYTYPGQEAREDDRANCEYWVGLCRGLGMEVQVAHDSTLLETRNPRVIYGYGARPPAMRLPNQQEVADVLVHLGHISADQIDVTVAPEVIQ